METLDDRVEWRMQLLGPALKRLRHGKGWTQTELAEAISGPDRKIGPDQPARWESGELGPNTRSLLRLLDALGASLADLEKTMCEIAQESGRNPEEVTPVEGGVLTDSGTIEVWARVTVEPEQVLAALRASKRHLREVARLGRAAAETELPATKSSTEESSDS